jgi:hypothetical protein
MRYRLPGEQAAINGIDSAIAGAGEAVDIPKIKWPTC